MMKHDLLFSILAAQNGLIKADELVEIGSAWAANPAKGLKERLREKISPEDMVFLEKAVERALLKHGGDLEKTIHSLKADELLFKTFGGDLLAHEAAQGSTPISSADPLFSDKVTLESPDRYSMKVEVDRGGIGKIFLALDEHIGREIAIKELLCEAAEDGTVDTPSRPSKAVKARFLREARVTGQLEHPAIVPVYEIGQRFDGTCYYTMRYIKGRNLAQAIAARGELSERLKLLPHLHDLCNAIAYAHSKGVIHRDIKPENVMIGEFGETVVLDWGLAKVKGQSDIGAEKLEKGLELLRDTEAGKTVAGHAMGTPAYMPPEQAMGEIEEIDEKSDIYSLGAVLYEILTGEPPHTGFTAFDIIAKVLNDPIVSVEKRDKRIPKELGAVAEKALKKNKKERYPSALGIAADIESYMAGGRVGAYEYSSWELTKRFAVKNKPAIFSFIAIIVVLALTMTIVSTALILIVVAVALILIFFSYMKERKAKIEAKKMAEIAEKERFDADESRAKAEANERETHYQLSLFLTEKAHRAYAEKDFLSAGIFAAAALKHTPYNPYGLYGVAAIAQKAGKKEKLNFVEAHSLLYQASMSGIVGNLQSFVEYDDAVQSIAFSPNGKLLASGGWDKKATLLDMTNLHKIAVFNHDERVSSVSFSPDGKLLAIAGKIVKIWDTASKEIVSTLIDENDWIRHISFSPNGGTIASSGGKDIKLWVIGEERKLFTLNVESSVFSLAFSPNGKILAAGLSGNTITLWDVDKKIIIARFNAHDGGVGMNISFSPDGKVLASISDDNILKFWDVASTRLTGKVHNATDIIGSMSFSPNGKYLALGGGEFEQTKILDIAQRKFIEKLQSHSSFVKSLAFSPDSKTLVSASWGKRLAFINVLEQKRGLSFSRHSGMVNSVAFSPNGKLLASASNDGTIKIFDIDNNENPYHTFTVDTGRVWTVEFSPSGNFVASGGEDGVIRIWNIAQKNLEIILEKHDARVFSTLFHPDGKRLISGSGDKTIKIWNLAEQKLISTIVDDKEVWVVALTPDGKILASSGGSNTVRIWNVETNKMIRILQAHTDWISGLSFSRDGKILVSSSKDKTIKIWEINSGRLLYIIEGHNAWVNYVKMSPDDKLILSTSDDRTARIWNSKTGECLQIFKLLSEGLAPSFSPDGKSFAVNDGSNVQIFPIDFDHWKCDAHELLRKAEKTAGMKLEGAKLRPMTPEEFEAYQ